MNFTLPLLGDKTNSDLLGKAKADAERLDALREQLEQRIQVEVRLLAAAALGDIGEHFPDSDPVWKDADSKSLLKRVVDMLVERTNELKYLTNSFFSHIRCCFWSKHGNHTRRTYCKTN